MTLTPTLTDEPRQTALLRAVGLDRLSPEQRELALNIANRYDLDLLLKHLVMIEGRAYITRDGLLHVAHKSGAFDGMETTEPVLADGFWRSTCSIFRKDMSRPFTYTGRYPESGKNRQYAPEMAIKVGEVMALRRAFDVSAPAFEERWAADGETPPEEPTPPTPLADRIVARATAVAPRDADGFHDEETPRSIEEVHGVVQSTSPAVQEQTPTPGDRNAARRARRAAAAPKDPGERLSDDVVETVENPEPEPGMDLTAFANAIVGYDRDEVRALARSTYPDAKSFGSLSDAQRTMLFDRVVAELDQTEPVGETPDDGGPDEPPVLSPMPVEVSNATPYVEPEEDQGEIVDPLFTGAPRAAVSPRRVGDECGNPSPWTDGVVCGLRSGHPGAHRAAVNGAPETW